MKANNIFHDLFVCVVFETNLNLDTSVIHKYCSKLKSVAKGVVHSNQGGWQSPPITPNDLPVLSSEIEKHANVFKNTFLFKNPLKICNMWININNYKDSNLEHYHHQCTLSGVYYVKVPPKSGSLRFIHPASAVIQSDWHGVKKENYNKYNAEQWIFKPQENVLFLFPSWLKHSVEPHLNKKERVSLSFNLK